MMRHLKALMAALVFACALPVSAHKASDSYLVLNIQGHDLTGQWDVALRDIDFAIGLDANGDGAITWGEVQARQSDLDSWALGRLSVQRGGECTVTVAEHLVDDHTDGAYAVLRLTGHCPGASGNLALSYRLLFDVDALHRGLLRLDLDGVNHTAVLSPDTGVLRITAGETSRWTQFLQYIVEGIGHIAVGFDHLLFLMSLLLPAVLVFKAARWESAGTFRPVVGEVLGLVTAFTVAHSITLTLAAFQIIELPTRLVESGIALSVVLSAANNLYPVVQRRRWLVAFSFGLIHGLAFATVLTELGLPRDALVLSLLGFNLGVEFAQLAVAAVFVPLAYALRDTLFYRKVVFVGGSWLTLLVALVWLIERGLNLKVITA